MIASVADVAEEAEEICPPRGISVKKSHSSKREDADEDAECCDVQRWKSLQHSAIGETPPDLFLPIIRFPIPPKVFLIGGRPVDEDEAEVVTVGHEDDPIVHVVDADSVVLLLAEAE